MTVTLLPKQWKWVRRVRQERSPFASPTFWWLYNATEPQYVDSFPNINVTIGSWITELGNGKFPSVCEFLCFLVFIDLFPYDVISSISRKSNSTFNFLPLENPNQNTDELRTLGFIIYYTCFFACLGYSMCSLAYYVCTMYVLRVNCSYFALLCT